MWYNLVKSLSSRKLTREPVAKLKHAEVWIERRFIGSTRRDLMARMVEWSEGLDGEGQTPTYGRCMLSPNLVLDVEMAKKLVHRYLDPVCDEVVFVVNI
jgi:hypothetical protein